MLRMQECKKPRCVFSNRKLSEGQTVQLQKLIEEYSYYCGAELAAESHQLHGVVTTRLGLTCETHIEWLYFSARQKFPRLCYACGVEVPLEVPEDVAEKYRGCSLSLSAVQRYWLQYSNTW